MKRSLAILLIALSVLILQPTGSLAEWVVDGVPICTAGGNQIYPQLVSDGSGGAIICWGDSRGLRGDIYAQRINSSGEALWETNGVGVCTQIDYQSIPRLAPDGASGAIIAWEDSRNGDDDDLYAQRVDSSGQLLWDPEGVAIATATGDQWDPVLLPSGMGGAIIGWSDYRSDEGDVYTQRVDSAGQVLWDTNGVAVCIAPGEQDIPQIISDLAEGEIITWDDTRSGQGDIYAQRIDSQGHVVWQTNGVPICTTSGDQRTPHLVPDGGGGAIIAWVDRSGGDYDIYAQRVDANGSIRWDTNGVAICTTATDQSHLQLISDGAGGAIITWQDQRGGDYDIYAQRVDHNGNAPPVGVLTNCYAPGLPHGFSLAQNFPNPFNSTTVICYSLLVDRQGKSRSGGSRARTTSTSYVSLKVYNILGQEVRTLVDEPQAPGYYSVRWDGRDVSSGIYLYRLEAGGFTATRRIALLR